MIGVVDFGSGNTRSMLRALEAVGADARLLRRPGELEAADRLVLPGVGAAGSAVRALRAADLWDPIRDRARGGTPFLGVCLGAQLMLDRSEEDGADGLGLVSGTCRAFPSVVAGGPRIVPHVGWNTVELDGGRRRADAYFVHGYWLDPAEASVVAGTTEVDGFRFPSLLRTDSMVATQFHPEKSGRFGRALLAAFAQGRFDGRAAAAAGSAMWT